MKRLLALAVLISLGTSVAQAQKSYGIRRFDADITVNLDGTVDITEEITAQFIGSWNGIYRMIPVDYRTPQGFNWSLNLDLIGATAGPEAAPLKVERSRERHYIKYKIWVPGAQDATRTIQLHYRARNGLRFFSDHDELYWNVTGDEWPVPIDTASATVRLPEGAKGVRAISFNGVYGSTAQDAKVSVEGTTVRVALSSPLQFHEGLTVVVGWDKGLIAEPSKAEVAAGFLAANWPLGIPIVVFFLVFTAWYRVGRDPARLPVVVQYDPPDSLTPAEAGTLIDYSADMRDITATVVDLAVRGRLRIEERNEEVFFGLWKKKEFYFVRLEPEPRLGERGLEPHEKLVLDGIFEDGAREVALSSLENEFYRHLPAIRESIFARLLGRGLYRAAPDKVRARWVGGGIGLGIAIGLLGTLAAGRLGLNPLPFIVSAILSGLIVVVFGQFMPARTVKGARALERVLGFEEFLSRVEGERFRQVVKTPEMFERLLPYAMAFQVEKRWARAFEGICHEPPRWYVGGEPGSFSVGHFSSRLSDLSSRTQSAMTSSPRSSGGSGFSGGSSGGGGGGGGGGAF